MGLGLFMRVHRICCHIRQRRRQIDLDLLRARDSELEDGDGVVLIVVIPDSLSKNDS